MAEVLLIRHGQSTNNASNEVDRVADPDLTQIGQHQAEATANWLASHRIDCLYCSPFLRSLKTALPISQNKRIPVRVQADLYEVGGCYSGNEASGKIGEAGLGRSQLVADYPGWDIDESILESGWWARDYETWEQGIARAFEVAKWISGDIVNRGGVHAMVIHADFKRLLIDAMLSLFPDATLAEPDPRDEFLDARLYNTGISRLSWDAQAWNVQRFNSVEHLPPEWVT